MSHCQFIASEASYLVESMKYRVDLFIATAVRSMLHLSVYCWKNELPSEIDGIRIDLFIATTVRSLHHFLVYCKKSEVPSENYGIPCRVIYCKYSEINALVGLLQVKRAT